MVRRAAWVVVVSMAFAAPVMAQRGGGAGGERPPGGPGGPGGGRQAPGIKAMADRLSSSADMDEAQQAQLAEIVATYEQKAEQVGGGNFRELADKMREAREAGDMESAGEYRRQMRDAARAQAELRLEFLDAVEPILREDQLEAIDRMRGRIDEMAAGPGGRGMLLDLKESLNLSADQATQFDALASKYQAQMMQDRGRGNFAQIMQDFTGELEGILSEEQKAQLAEFRGRAQGGRTIDVRRLFEIAKRLDLDTDQKKEMRGIEEDAKRALAELRRDRDARNALSEATQKEIRAILTAEQQKQFDALIAGGGRPGRGAPGEDDERPRRRARGQDADAPDKP